MFVVQRMCFLLSGYVVCLTENKKAGGMWCGEVWTIEMSGGDLWLIVLGVWEAELCIRDKMLFWE